MLKSRYRQTSLFWKPIPPRFPSADNGQRPAPSEGQTESKRVPVQVGGHPLVDQAQNQALRAYEMDVKARFDQIETVIKQIIAQQSRANFVSWARRSIKEKLGIELPESLLNCGPQGSLSLRTLYGPCVFEQFLNFSREFFLEDPLQGQNTEEAREMFKNAGLHAVGVAPCADGRLAHFVSYVLRLPYAATRRKAHAGSLFDISESVRNWVFIEHNRFREGVPNSAEEPTRYLKMAVYHFSKADPLHQGCAAHGSDDAKAAKAALDKLNDFRQAIENRFGCGSTVDILLLGLNTDDDSLRVHVPDERGQICLTRFIETQALYRQTREATADEARAHIYQSVKSAQSRRFANRDSEGVARLLAWLIEKNFSQIEYVNAYEDGCYEDIGHAERFIGIGNGFEEVQLRNLTYYSFLDTLEEGMNDVNVGIKIFKGLNVKRGLPIPIIIRCDYDGRVPGSKERAAQKARRINQALHDRYQELSQAGLLQTMATLRDAMTQNPAERLTV